MLKPDLAKMKTKFQNFNFFPLLPILLIVAILNNGLVNSLPDNINIGVLFDKSDMEIEENAFRHAIERVNQDSNLLPRSRLFAQVEKLPNGDSYHASKKVCQMINVGIAGIFGPQSPQSASYIQTLCDQFHIPHFETKLNFRSAKKDFLVNLYPSPSVLSRAYADIIETWGWKKYVILYQDHESLLRLQNLLQANFPFERESTVMQLSSDNDFRPMAKFIKLQTNIRSIIIDCDSSKLKKFFKDAQEVGIVNQYYKYFVTNLDIHTVDFGNDFENDDINITAFRLIDPENPTVVKIIKEWNTMTAYGSQNRSNSNIYVDRLGLIRNYNEMKNVPKLPNNILPVEAALIYDAIELFVRALHVLEASQPGIVQTFNGLNCKNIQETFQYGLFLKDVYNKIQFEGLSGLVYFDRDGARSDLILQVVEFTQRGFAKLGFWDGRSSNKDKFTWTRSLEDTLKRQEEDLKNKTFIVTTKISSPYCMETNETGVYEGYGVDLINLIAEALKFKYEIHLVNDNKYGEMNNNTKYGWDGCIGEVLEGKADVAIGDMTINYDRERTIDFTMPYMNLGISILYKKPKKNPPSLFSFLEPFDLAVWIYMATAYLGVSVILFILSRITPFEWTPGHPCEKDPDELENVLTLANCLWHNWGSLMQQGSDIAPKAGSTRMVAGIWWFFTLIMISSYTANLAAFLTKEGMEAGVNDVRDLPKQTKVKYGCLSSGTTAAFFRDSTFPLYKEIWNNMQNMRPSPFVDSTKDGMERVDKSDGEYAFFMESSSIEYVTERNCKLTQMGGLLDSKGYGIALRKNSKYREAFSSEVLKLQERGKLEELKVKWWKEKGGGQCKVETTKSGGAQALTLAHVGGVFFVLILGSVFGVLMAAFEFLWKSRKLAKNEDECWFKEMWKELKFALKCQNSKKPVPKSASPSEHRSLTGSVPYIDLDKKQIDE